MTVGQGFAALMRQWLVVLVGLALTGAGAMLAARTERIYWTQTTVRFLSPEPPRQGVDANSLVTSTESLITLAGFVLTDLDVPAGPKVASPLPNIVDVGIYDGVWIRLPDYGGQWSHSFNDAFLNVQVSGRDPDEVRARTSAAVTSIARVLNDRQDALAVPGQLRAVTQASPPMPTLSVAQVGRVKPFLGFGLLGTGATFALALYVDRVRGRRKDDAERMDDTGPFDLVVERVPVLV